MDIERKALLALAASWGLAFTLVVCLEPHYQAWEGSRARSGNLLELTLGEGRRLFSNHFFQKADVYFHAGYYPSMFDNRDAFETSHIAEDTGAVATENEGDEHDFQGKPRDWLEAFGRRFQPNEHAHVDHGTHHHGEAEEHEEGEGEVKEILPWLRLATALDPENEQTYVVTAFWLRSQLDAPEQAGRVLREGLRANPRSIVLLTEMARLLQENPATVPRAINLLDLAARYWEEDQRNQPEPDLFLFARIHMLLADLHRQQGDLGPAIAIPDFLWYIRVPNGF